MLEFWPLLQPLLGSTADLAMIIFVWVAWKLDRRLVRLEAHIINGVKKRVE